MVQARGGRDVPPPFRAELPLDPWLLFETRRRLREWLADAGADRDEIHDVTTACSEACAESIQQSPEHPGSTVRLDVSMKDSTILVVVGDDGDWRAKRFGSDDGLGLRIIEAMMDTVVIGPAAGGAGAQVGPRPEGQGARAAGEAAAGGWPSGGASSPRCPREGG